MGLTPERDLLTRRNLGKLVLGTAASGVISGIKSKEARALTQEELGPVKHYFVGEGENKRDMGPLIFPLKDGTGAHYAIEGLENFTYPQGYAVRGIMWEVFQQFGREPVWGPPEARPYIDGLGRICQPFQKGIFQLTINRTKELLALAKKNEKEPFKEYTWLDKYLSANKLQLTKPPEWDNVFQRKGDMNRNDWLEAKFIPRPQQIAYPSTNPTWEQIKSSHLALLETNPKIKDYYFSNPQWLEQYGLPVAVKEYQDVITVRCQRAALHLWKSDLPWAKKGEVTVANAVLLVKEKTDGAIIPTDSLLAEFSERFYEIWSVGYRVEGGSRSENQPPDIVGSDAFIQYWKKILDFMQRVTPDFYKDAIQYVFTIKERDVQRGQFVGAYYPTRTIYTDPAPDMDISMVPERFFSISSLTVVHEANHIKTRLEDLQGSLKYGELAAKKAELELAKKLGDIESIERITKTITNIDDPKYQWWRR